MSDILRDIYTCAYGNIRTRLAPSGNTVRRGIATSQQRISASLLNAIANLNAEFVKQSKYIYGNLNSTPEMNLPAPLYINVIDFLLYFY